MPGGSASGRARPAATRLRTAALAALLACALAWPAGVHASTVTQTGKTTFKASNPFVLGTDFPACPDPPGSVTYFLVNFLPGWGQNVQDSVTSGGNPIGPSNEPCPNATSSIQFVHNPSDQTPPPNDQAEEAKVTFTPSGPGGQTPTLTFINNFNGFPDACLSNGGILLFGGVPAGGSASRSFTLTNCGHGDLDVGALQLGSSPPGGFGLGMDGCSGRTLLLSPPNNSCTTFVNFNPFAVAGFTGAVTVPDDASSGPTQTVSLSGNGTQPDSADLSVIKQTSGNDVVGQVISHTITIRNNGPSTAANVRVADRFTYQGTGSLEAPLFTVPGDVSCSAPKVSTPQPTGIAGRAEQTAFTTCDIKSLPPGTAIVITMAFVLPREHDSGNDEVEVASDTPDPNGANNTARVGDSAFSANDWNRIRNNTSSTLAVSGGRATMSFQCPAPGGDFCKLSEKIQMTVPAKKLIAAAKRRTVLLGTVAATVPGHKRRKLRVHLTKAGKRVVAKARHVSAHFSGALTTKSGTVHFSGNRVLTVKRR